MILLFKIDPFSRPVAIIEMLLLLAFAAFVGWLIAKLISGRRISSLREAIRHKSLELEECNNHVLNYRDMEFIVAEEDDLKLIEGIGPKIEELLKKEGLTTFYSLALTPTEKVLDILRKAGARFQIHDPTTWRDQAILANSGRWEELEALQNRLIGGREE